MKALIVETFEKNKNIFVSSIASFVNHCERSGQPALICKLRLVLMREAWMRSNKTRKEQGEIKA